MGRKYKKERIVIVWFIIATSVSITMGTIYGILSKEYLRGFGIAFGISYTMWLVNCLLGKFIYPQLEKLPRGKKMKFEISLYIPVNTIAIFFALILFYKIYGIEFLLTGGAVFGILVIGIIICIIILGFTYAIMFYKELKSKELAEEKLKSLLTEEKLKALKAQINPHFLFNTLNTITDLIRKNYKEAEEVTQKLSDIFRYTLISSDKKYVSLKEELDFINDYLDIHKVRFGNKLKVYKNIDEKIKNILVPSLILQPIVENVIKYGIDIENGEINIELLAKETDKVIEIQIKDRGKGIPDYVKDKVFELGTGLKNVNNRLKTIYGEKFGIEIKNNIPKGTIVIIRIPKEWSYL